MRTGMQGNVQGRWLNRTIAIDPGFLTPLLLFTLAVAILAQPQLAPHPPFTQMPFVCLPMAVFAVAFIHRPLFELPVYADVYLMVRV